MHTSSEPGSERTAADRLDSWKEIAAHFRRDVRTVRRWEQTEGLPVHRHTHRKRASIYAYRAELDEWWKNHPSTRRAGVPSTSARHPKRPWLWGVTVPSAVLAVGLLIALWPSAPPVPQPAQAADLGPEDFEAEAGAMSNLLMRENDPTAAREHYLRARSVAPEWEMRYAFFLPRTELFPVYQSWLEGRVLVASLDAARIAATLPERSVTEQNSLVVHLLSVNLTLGRFEAARDLVRRHHADTPWIELELAEIAAADSNDELARKHLENWLRLAGQRPGPGHFLLARTTIGAGFGPTAPSSSPMDVALYQLEAGWRAVGQQRYREAVPLLENGLEGWLQSNSSRAFESYHSLAEARFALEGAEAAAAVLEDASKLRGRAAVTGNGYFIRNQWWLAQLYRDLGRTAEAESLEQELVGLLAVADADHHILRALQMLTPEDQPAAN